MRPYLFKIIILIKNMVMRKQSYSQSRNKIIYIINQILLLYMCSPFVLKSIPQMQSGLVVVYNNTNTELPASTTSNFTLPFGQAFANMPAVAVGNGGYSSLDRYYNQFWGLTHSVLSNLTGLIIHVRLQSNTKTNILFISYIAVDDIPLNSNLFNIYQMQYNSTQLVNTSVGTGNRIDTLYYTPSNGTVSFSLSSMVMSLTTKVYMRNTNDFGFVISCGLQIQLNGSSNSSYSNSLTITILAINTVVLQNIGFYTIVLNKNLIRYDNYYQSYMGSVSAYSTNVSSIFYFLNFTQSSVSNYDSANVSQFINAGGFMGFSNIMANGGNNIGFNWDFGYDSSNVSYIKIKNNYNVQLLTFNFFIFGVVDCIYWSVSRQSCASGCSSNETHQSSSNICRLCNSICKTCSLSTTNCTSCQYGVYYFQAYTCRTCNSTNLTDTQKIECGIYQPVVPDQPTVVTKTNPPYWLASLSLIPLIAILLFCYWRKNRFRPKIEVKQRSGLAEHPSIQL